MPPFFPEPLMPGDTIGVAAPAGAFDKEKFHDGLKVLEGMGYKTYVPEEIFSRDSYLDLAGEDHQRAGLLNSLFAKKEVKGIICARGGFGSLRILSLLDFEIIRSNPKIFVGFSDISALLSTFYTRCGLVTFHGPMVTTLEDSDPKSKEAFVSALSSAKKITLTPEEGKTIKSGSASGIVSGGNLTTLCHLVGTPFEPDFDGHILLIEDTGEAPYRIDRMLIQMKLAGCFKGLSGLALGTFEGCGSFDDICRIISGIFKDDRIPILAGFAIGHGKRNITLPLGINATLDADHHILLFHESATGNLPETESR